MNNFGKMLQAALRGKGPTLSDRHREQMDRAMVAKALQFLVQCLRCGATTTVGAKDPWVCPSQDRTHIVKVIEQRQSGRRNSPILPTG